MRTHQKVHGKMKSKDFYIGSKALLQTHVYFPHIFWRFLMLASLKFLVLETLFGGYKNVCDEVLPVCLAMPYFWKYNSHHTNKIKVHRKTTTTYDKKILFLSLMSEENVKPTGMSYMTGLIENTKTPPMLKCKDRKSMQLSYYNVFLYWLS